MTKVFDLNGAERDLAWLQANYGARVAACGDAGPHFEVAEVRIQEGPAVVTVEVRDEAGGRLPNFAVAWHWPNAPHDLTQAAYAPFLTRFKSPVDIQWTAAPNGDTGFGTGPGAYIQGPIADGGAHATWVLSDQYRSDALDRIGQLGGTEHRGPNKVVFRLVSGTPADDPADGGDGLEALRVLLTDIRDLIKAGFRL